MRAWSSVLGALGVSAVVTACGGGDSSPGAGAGGVGTSGGAASGAGAIAGTAGVSDGGAAGSGQGASGATGQFDTTCMGRTTSHIAGSRIALRLLETSEGDQAFRGYYDVQLGHDCRWLRDAEGKTRCFPDTVDTVSPHYLDAGCTDEVVYQGICGGTHFALPASDDPCDSRWRVFAYGAELASSSVFQRDASGACAEVGSLNRPPPGRGASLQRFRGGDASGLAWAGPRRYVRLRR